MAKFLLDLLAVACCMAFIAGWAYAVYRFWLWRASQPPKDRP